MQQNPTIAQKNLEQNPIFQPIKFVYTETIGSLKDKLQQITDPYVWTFQDILQPKPLSSTLSSSNVYYYLFHTAPIYNWLRKLDTKILANYINQNRNMMASGQTLKGQLAKFKSIHNQKVLASSNTNNAVQFNAQIMKKSLKTYIEQWEIVKLSACLKVKINSTKTLANDKNHHHKHKSDSKDNNHNKLSQKYIHNKESQNKNNNSFEKIQCVHLIKQQRSTTNYYYDRFENAICCSQVYCEECQKQVKVHSEIVSLPFAPIFKQNYGRALTIMKKGQTVNYQLNIMLGNQLKIIRSANGIWYAIQNSKSSPISYDKIDMKRLKVFIYHKVVKNLSNNQIVLRKAEPMIEKPIFFGGNQNNKYSNSSNSNRMQQEQKQQQNRQTIINEHNLNHRRKKDVQKADQKIKKNDQQKSSNNNDGMINEQQQQQSIGELEEIKKNTLPIIMNKKKTDRKVFKEYKKTVEQLLPKNKQKDQYEANYDKGKVKKIRKRQEFRTANFFDLYKEKASHKNQTHVNQQEINQGGFRENKDVHEHPENEDDQGISFSKRFQKKFNKEHNPNRKFRGGSHKGSHKGGKKEKNFKGGKKSFKK